MKANKNQNDQEDQEVTFITRRSKLRYKQSTDTLYFKDLQFLIKSFMKCTDAEAGEFSHKLLKLLDKDKEGFIRTDILAKETLGRLGMSTEDEISNLLQIFYLSLLSKTESIVFRLKLLSVCPWVTNQNKYTPTINFILKTIGEGDLYDLDTAEITRHLTSKEDTKAEISSLLQYSNIETSNQREKDFILIRSKGKKYTNPFNYSSFHSNNSTQSNQKRRRSTNLSTIVSPSIIARLYTQICKIDQIDFNIFDLDEIVGKKATVYVANEILSKLDIVEKEMVPPEILTNFIEEIVEHYDRVHAVYHNDLHAGDVMQTLFTIFIKGNLQEKMQMGQLDTFSALVAALCHDFKHPGQSNLYHINSRSSIALKYNDTSVLENYHLAQTFKVLSHPKKNIFVHFTPEEYRICRKRMIEGIIATDMTKHQLVLAWVKTRIDSFTIKKGQNFEKLFDPQDTKLFDAQQGVLNFLIHMADISNPGKPDKISEGWTKKVYDEFFIQGDSEKAKNLPVSDFCDRTTTDINKAMIGFITFVVGPTIDILVTIVNEVSEYRDYCRANLKKYQNNVKKEERKMIKK